MPTWPTSNKADPTVVDADSDSISGARADIEKVFNNQNTIIDFFNLGTPGAGDDNKVLTYDHTTGYIVLETSTGGSQSPLVADLDQDGFMIKDTSRNFQILGNESNTTTLQSYFDSFSAPPSGTPGQRVHGVVNVSEVTTTTDRIHSNPRLSYVQASQDSTGNANSGRIRQNYVEGIYDLAGYDNTVSGFGRGHNGMFVSGLLTNSSTTTSNITESTAFTITPQIDTVDANAIVVTDMAGLEVQGYCNGVGSSATNFYGFYYNAPAGDESANLGTTNHYSFYGADSNATLYNAGPLEASGLSYPTTDGSANQVIKTNGSGTLSFGDISQGTAGSYTITSPTGTSETLTADRDNGMVQFMDVDSNVIDLMIAQPSNMVAGDTLILVLKGNRAGGHNLKWQGIYNAYGTASFGLTVNDIQRITIVRDANGYTSITSGNLAPGN